MKTKYLRKLKNITRVDRTRSEDIYTYALDGNKKNGKFVYALEATKKEHPVHSYLLHKRNAISIDQNT